MRILVLGGDGMLGHQLLGSLKDRHELRVTLRQAESMYAPYRLFNSRNSYFNVEVLNAARLQAVFSDFNPEVVINAVGVVKQRKSAKEAIPSLEINALFPHRLAELCKTFNARLIHLSTDCVFSGRTGHYVESDKADAEDLYGRTKYLGEVSESHCLTLRTSIIGLELARKTSLVEWFLGQHGMIKGFRRAIYTGITTQEMGRLIDRLIVQHPLLSGVWHVASNPINKYDLLTQLSTLLHRADIQIQADDTFVCDRSLNGEAFSLLTGYHAPTWDAMLKELALQIQESQCVEMKC